MSNRDVGPYPGVVWDGVSRLEGPALDELRVRSVEESGALGRVPILSAVDLDEERRTFVEKFKQALSERVFALLGALPKIKNNKEGKAVLREAVGEALAEVWPDAFEPAITVKCEPPTEEQRSQRMTGSISISFMGKPVTGFSEDSFVAASAPTPVLGVPVAQMFACNNCGSATCNYCRAQRGMGPAGVKRERRPTSKASAETGYRVLPYAVWMNTSPGDRPGETFSIPDLAQSKARKLAKSEGETYIILRDGVRWMRAGKDGALDPLT